MAETPSDSELVQNIKDLQTLAKESEVTPRDVVRKFRALVDEILKLIIAANRPLLSQLYNASRSGQAMFDEAETRYQPLGGNLSLSLLIKYLAKDGLAALNYYPFAMMQQSSANVYAAILMFECDKLFRLYRKTLSLGDGDQGPQVAGHAFSRIVRAAGNQYRHGSQWPEDETEALAIEDAQVLRDLGIPNVRSPNAQSEVLAAIGGDHYFDFEDRVIQTLADISKEAAA